VIGRLDDDGQVRDDVVDRRGLTGDPKRYGFINARDETARRSVLSITVCYVKIILAGRDDRGSRYAWMNDQSR
jgi:hypothetical protein